MGVKKARCRRCGRPYTMGHNGIINFCDTCAGVKRDKNGYAWEPGETEMTLIDVNTGQIKIITRAEALGEVQDGR